MTIKDKSNKTPCHRRWRATAAYTLLAAILSLAIAVNCTGAEPASPTPIPSNTPTHITTNTPAPKLTPTLTKTPLIIPTNTHTPTKTPSPPPTTPPTPSNTPTPTSPAPTPTLTPTITPTNTQSPTNTPTITSTPTIEPTSTNTPTPPATTPAPTDTPTPLPSPTNTTIPTPTNTPAPSTPTPLPSPTNTPLPTPTETPTPIPTPTPLTDVPPIVTVLQFHGQPVISQRYYDLRLVNIVEASPITVQLQASDPNGDLSHIALIDHNNQEVDRVYCGNNNTQCVKTLSINAPDERGYKLIFYAIAYDNTGSASQPVQLSIQTRRPLPTPTPKPEKEHKTPEQNETTFVSIDLPARQAGVLTHPSGAQIEIPAGALAESARVSITEVNPPDSSVEVGRVFDFSAGNVQLNAPVTLQIPYEIDADTEISRIRAIHWNEEYKLWEVLPGLIDGSAKTIEVSTQDLSWLSSLIDSLSRSSSTAEATIEIRPIKVENKIGKSSAINLIIRNYTVSREMFAECTIQDKQPKRKISLQSEPIRIDLERGHETERIVGIHQIYPGDYNIKCDLKVGYNVIVSAGRRFFLGSSTRILDSYSMDIEIGQSDDPVFQGANYLAGSIESCTIKDLNNDGTKLQPQAQASTNRPDGNADTNQMYVHFKVYNNDGEIVFDNYSGVTNNSRHGAIVPSSGGENKPTYFTSQNLHRYTLDCILYVVPSTPHGHIGQKVERLRDHDDLEHKAKHILDNLTDAIELIHGSNITTNFLKNSVLYLITAHAKGQNTIYIKSNTYPTRVRNVRDTPTHTPTPAISTPRPISPPISTPRPISPPPPLTPFSSVCGRTPQVVSAILDEIRGVSRCQNVTSSHLSRIRELNIRGKRGDNTGKNIRHLSRGDFAGLYGLEKLQLSFNNLRSLPYGIFDGLSNLEMLSLRDNSLRSLPDSVFNGLHNLKILYLDDNRLRSLPNGTFNGLHNLQKIYLDQNNIRSLRVSQFRGLSQLKVLKLNDNQLSDFQPSDFSGQGLSNLRTLYMGNKSPGTGQLESYRTVLPRLRNLQVITPQILVTCANSPIYGRTDEIMDTIIAVIPQTWLCRDVTSAHLSELRSLDIGDKGIRSLRSGDFNGLPNLNTLRLDNNHIPSLPKDIFNQLSNLQNLYLYDNQLETLDARLFNRVTKIRILHLNNNHLNSLPENIFENLHQIRTLQLHDNRLQSLDRDIFDRLSRLQWLTLHHNRLTSLDANTFDGLSQLRFLLLDYNQLNSLPRNIFDDLSQLEVLSLDHNQLGSLHHNTFDGLSALRSLYLHNNNLSSLPPDLFDGLSNLERLYLQNNNLDNLPPSYFSRQSLNNLRTLHIGNTDATPEQLAQYRAVLPNLTSLKLVSVSTTSRGEPIASCGTSPLNGRTQKVVDAIVATISGITRCEDVTATHLATISELNLASQGISTLHSDDFDGLSNLTVLWLSRNNLSSLDEDIFDGLSNLTDLWLDRNNLLSLDKDIFDGLSNLTGLTLGSNSLTSLDKDIFDGLSRLLNLDLANNRLSSLDKETFKSVFPSRDLRSLRRLYLANNSLSSLDKETFKDLRNLQELELGGNNLTSLDKDIFDGLPRLEHLYLGYNNLTSLDKDIFDGLGSLRELYLWHNNLTSLDEDTFDGLSLLELYLSQNNLTSLDEDTFDGLSFESERRLILDLSHNNLSSLDKNIFDGLSFKESEYDLILYLSHNNLTSLDKDIFDGLSEVELFLDLSYNNLTSLDEDIFDGLSDLYRLDLQWNNLDNQPPSYFSGQSLDNLRFLYLGNTDATPEQLAAYKAVLPALTTLKLKSP